MAAPSSHRFPRRVAEGEIRPHGQPCPAVPELTLIGVGHYRSAMTLETHLHPGQMEICYLQRGRITWWAGEEIVPLQGGDVYLTWPGEAHGGVNDVFEPCRLCFLTVHLPRHPKAGYLQLPAKEARALCRRLHALPQRHFRGGESIAKKFERITNGIHTPTDSLSNLTVRTTLVALLTEVVRFGEQAAQRKDYSPQVIQALKRMEQNLAEPLLLEQIADGVGWSLSHFKTRFRREVGASPAQRYLQFRVQAAIQAIQQTDTPLVKIAMDFGFGSSQYLANCIKRVTGKTPREYRSSVRGQSSE